METLINLNEAIIEQIKPLQLNESAAEGHAEILADLVRNGEVSPLDMATRLRYIIDVCEQAMKGIQENCVSEAEKFDKKEKIIVNTAQVAIAETGVKYDYASCGDTEWQLAQSQEEALSTARKQRETFLKTLTAPLTIADAMTGEMITITPPSKKSSRSIKITFQP